MQDKILTHQIEHLSLAVCAVEKQSKVIYFQVDGEIANKKKFPWVATQINEFVYATKKRK